MALGIAAATAGVLPVFLTGALSVQLRHALNLSGTDIGVAVAAFFGASALCSVSFGAAAERIGPLTVMRLASVLALASMLAVAAFARSLPTLAASLVVGGLANGGMQPAVNLLLSRTVHDARQGLAFGVKQAAIPTATLLSGLAVPTLALTAGWRAGFLAGAALVAVVGVLLQQAAHGSGSSAPARRPRSAVARALAGTRTRPGSSTSRPAGGLDLLPLAVLAAGMGAAVAAANAMGSFVVPSAVAHGVSPGLAGLLAALGSAVGLSARVGFGWHADRPIRRQVPRAQRHLTVVAVLVTTGILGYLALASGRAVLLVPGVVVAFGAGWGFNGLFNLAVVRSHPHAPARATGVTQVGTYIGGMAGPLAFGIVTDHLGYGDAWTMCAILAAAGALTMTAAARLLHRRHRQAPAPAAGRSGPASA